MLEMPRAAFIAALEDHPEDASGRVEASGTDSNQPGIPRVPTAGGTIQTRGSRVVG